MWITLRIKKKNLFKALNVWVNRRSVEGQKSEEEVLKNLILKMIA